MTIHSVFDAQGRRIAEYDEATGALIREYVWLGWEPVAVIEGGVTYLIRTDHIGRPVFATNTAEVKTWTASYDPFGSKRSGLRHVVFFFRNAAGRVPTATHDGVRNRMDSRADAAADGPQS